MTNTYGGDPDNTPRDAVRLLIGDTDSSDWQVSDEEIAFALTKARDSQYGAAALMCRALAAKYARQVSTSVDGTSQQLQQRVAHYREMAAEYDDLAKQGLAGIVPAPFMGAGGDVNSLVTLSGPDTIFSIGRDDFLLTGPSDDLLN